MAGFLLHSYRISCRTDRNDLCYTAIDHGSMDVGVDPEAELVLPMPSTTARTTTRNFENTFLLSCEYLQMIKMQVPKARYI